MQKVILVGVMFLVLFGLGGFVAYDIKTNNRMSQFTGMEDVKSNWEWEDNWDSQANPVYPETRPNDDLRPQPQRQYVAENYRSAIRKSGELGMPILVIFSTENCHHCKRMKRDTLTDGRVKSFMKNYIFVNVDASSDRQTTSKFGVRGVPAYVITNVNERDLKSDAGYLGPNEFASWLNNPNLYKQPKKDMNMPDTQPDDDDSRWPQFPRDRDRDDNNRRQPG